MNKSQKDMLYILCIIKNFYKNVQGGLFEVESMGKG
jgi:hypothetical protein